MQALIGQPPVERYGMTETLITVSTRADGERRPGWVGHPITGVESRLVDDTGSVIGHDGETIGELQIRGATMFDELPQPSRRNRSVNRRRLVPTGDAAVIDAGGFHRIVGRPVRRHHQDRRLQGRRRRGRGRAARPTRAVVEAAVVGVSDADLGQRIVAYVVCSDVDDVTLIDHVAAAAVGAQAARARSVSSTVLPRNAMGKVQKSLLT